MMQVFRILAFMLALPLLAESESTAVVTAPSGLVLREQADAASKSLGLLPKGTIVHIVSFKEKEVTIGDVSGRWLQVDYRGKSGWCFSGYLDAVSGLNAAFRQRLLKNLWGPAFGWGMYTRFILVLRGRTLFRAAGARLGLWRIRAIRTVDRASPA